nr:MAG TPA: hypothetical protein [Caudoviricetes sp.]
MQQKNKSFCRFVARLPKYNLLFKLFNHCKN